MAAPDQALRVVLVDDHHLFRSGLRGMLETGGIEIVGEATDGAKAIRLVRELAPDLTIVDLKMPGASDVKTSDVETSGIEAIRGIVAEDPDAKLLALTVSAREADVIEALAAGACGYLLKDMSPDELVRSVKLVARGHAVLSGDIARALARSRRDSQAAEQAEQDGEEVALTERELEVLRLIVDGADNTEIGRQLSISKHTVKTYVASLFEKLGVGSRVQAAVYAVRRGLI